MKIKLIAKKLIRPDAKSRALKARNATWLADPAIQLIERLEKMENPIAIAVGCGHLYGKIALVKSLEDTGKFQIFKRDLNALEEQPFIFERGFLGLLLHSD